MANQVTLTFAGETKPLEDSFSRVGDSAKKAGHDVEDAGEGFRKAGEAADEVDTKAMGFRDTLTGVQDTAGGVANIMKGNLFDGFLQLGAGIGDLGSGFYNLLIPALEKTKVATLAQNAASKVTAAATKVWAGVQWLMNSALLASPITWIVVGIVALVAVIVLIATKTDWFQRGWKVAWSGIKAAAQATWNFLKQIPGWIGTAFSKVANVITAPFRQAFNLVARAWNATIGQLSWSVPGWVPIIGGNSISVPHLPTFHSGGIVPGVVGTNTVAVLQAGESIGSVAAAAGQGNGGTVTLGSDGSELGELLVRIIGLAMRRQYSGDATALGIKVAT